MTKKTTAESFRSRSQGSVRPTLDSEADLLPDIERSAGLAFLEIAELAWIAKDDVQTAESHRRQIRLGNSWVALDEAGELVGFLAAEIVATELHIWVVAVRHEKQGLGYGRLLMETAINAAGQRGLSAVTLTTFRSVKWNEPFYKTLGFETLRPEQITGRLAEALGLEAEHGIPRDMRCAMRRRIDMTG